MNRIDRVLHLSVLTATVIGTCALLPAAPAQAVNLIQNSNFEAGGGSFANWIQSNPADPNVFVLDGTNGTKTAYLGSIAIESLSQTLTTVAGTPYQIGFDLLSDGSINSFEARVNNTILFAPAFVASTIPTSPASPFQSSYRPFSFNFTGTGNDKLEFRFRNDSFFELDNVVFDGQVSTPVPEPLTILGTLVGGSAVLKLRKKLNSINTKAKV